MDQGGILRSVELPQVGRIVLALMLSLLLHLYGWWQMPLPEQRLTAMAGGNVMPAQSLSLALQWSAPVAAVSQAINLPEDRPQEVVHRQEAFSQEEALSQKEVLSQKAVLHRDVTPLSVAKTAAPKASAEKPAVDQAVTEKPSKARVQPESVEPADEVEMTSEASAPARAEQGLTEVPVISAAAFREPPAPPHYPRLALRKRQQGEARIRALVDRSGTTLEVVLVQSSGYGLLDQAALDAVAAWRFEAARVDGLAVKAWVEVPVDFSIR